MESSTSLANADVIVVDPFKPTPGLQKVVTGFDLENRLGSFTLESMFSRNFSFHNASVDFRHNASIAGTVDGRRSYGLALMSKGHDNADFGGHKVEGNPGYSVFTFNPPVPEVHSFYAETPTSVSYIDINADYLDQIIFDDSFGSNPAIDNLKHDVERNQFSVFAAAFGPTQSRIISDMENCPIVGGLGHLMLEGSLHQLIALQFASQRTSESRERIRHCDRDTIFAVRDYLNSTFTEDHSLQHIARKFGINQSKLKKLFKEIVGTPVIEYIYNLRMDYSKRLLLDHDLNVAEVAPIVGYRYANHFTAAFKRKYGVSPSRIKK